MKRPVDQERIYLEAVLATYNSLPGTPPRPSRRDGGGTPPGQAPGRAFGARVPGGEGGQRMLPDRPLREEGLNASVCSGAQGNRTIPPHPTPMNRLNLGVLRLSSG